MTNYSAYHRKKFEYLKKQTEDGGTCVKLVADSILKDFAGMNSEAARVLHFSMPDNEIWISSALSWPVRYRTLVHEIHERDRMLRGVPYWEAHSQALQAERTIDCNKCSQTWGTSPETCRACRAEGSQ